MTSHGIPVQTPTADSAVSSPAEDSESVYERYMLRHPSEIRGRLRQLVGQRSTVIVRMPDGHEVVSLALAVEEERLWLDVPRDPDQVARLEASPRLRFESAIDRIGVRFGSGGARLGEWEGLPAMAVDIPAQLMHLQRRECVRRMPDGPLDCLLHVARDTPATKPIRARVADIGGGGVALLLESGQRFRPVVGDRLDDAVLELPDDGPLRVALEARYALDLQAGSERILRVGCRFAGLGTRDEARVLRYVMLLDRAQAARRHPFAS